MAEDRPNLGIRAKDDNHRKALRRAALDLDMSVQDLFMTAVREYLERKQNSAEGPAATTPNRVLTLPGSGGTIANVPGSTRAVPIREGEIASVTQLLAILRSGPQRVKKASSLNLECLGELVDALTRLGAPAEEASDGTTGRVDVALDAEEALKYRPPAASRRRKKMGDG